MRRVMAVALCALAFLTMLPTRADAWWYWLDELSGPGPFAGLGFQWRLACINDPKPELDVYRKWEADRLATIQIADWNVQFARTELELKQAKLTVAVSKSRELPEDGDPRKEVERLRQEVEEAASTLEATLKIQERARAEKSVDRQKNTAFLDEVIARRTSVDPGDEVLRSRSSFKKDLIKKEDGHGNWATLFGVGCLTPVQRDVNPIASLNFRVGVFGSVRNGLKYDGDAPTVWLLQPELNFTAFIDPRKAIEVGAGVGVSGYFVAMPGVPPFSKFYWRPFILSVAPAPLLRMTANNWSRALTLNFSIVITPQELKASEFGSSGTYDVSKDTQAMVGVVFDLSRFGTRKK